MDRCNYHWGVSKYVEEQPYLCKTYQYLCGKEGAYSRRQGDLKLAATDAYLLALNFDGLQHADEGVHKTAAKYTSNNAQTLDAIAGFVPLSQLRDVQLSCLAGVVAEVAEEMGRGAWHGKHRPRGTGSHKSLISAASKFCHCLFPALFPIWDNKTLDATWWYLGAEIYCYKELLVLVRSELGNIDLTLMPGNTSLGQVTSLRYWDMAMWQYGVLG